METAPLYFVLYARAEYDSDTAGDTGRPLCMGSDFRAIRYLHRLNLSIKKHDLEKSRVFYKIGCLLSGALLEKFQKQFFDFFVALEFAQIRRKALSVKTQLLWQRLRALRGFCSCFPPCGVNCLLVR